MSQPLNGEGGGKKGCFLTAKGQKKKGRGSFRGGKPFAPSLVSRKKERKRTNGIFRNNSVKARKKEGSKRYQLTPTSSLPEGERKKGLASRFAFVRKEGENQGT